MASNKLLKDSLKNLILTQLDSVCSSLPHFSENEQDIYIEELIISKIKPIFIQAFRLVEHDQLNELKAALECMFQATSRKNDKRDAGYSLNRYLIINSISRGIFLATISFAFEDRKRLDALFTFDSLKTLYNNPKQYFYTYDALLSLRFLDLPFEIGHLINKPIFDQQKYASPSISSLVNLASFLTNIAAMVAIIPTTLVLKAYVHILSYLTRLQSALLNVLTDGNYDDLILDKLEDDDNEPLIEKNRQFNGVLNALMPLFAKELPDHVVGLIASIAYRTIILLPVAITFLVSAAIRDILEALPVALLLTEIPILIIAKTAIIFTLNTPLYIGAFFSRNQAPDALIETPQESHNEMPESILRDNIVRDADETQPLVNAENRSENLQDNDVDVNQVPLVEMDSPIQSVRTAYGLAYSVLSWLNASETSRDEYDDEYDALAFLSN